jgi:hypothetical protein
MHMRFVLPLLTVLMLLVTSRPAEADATAFLGITTTPANRPVRGFSAGISLLVVGFELEYANTEEDEAANAPSLRTGMGNLVVQTPFAGSGLQLYATLGAGLYRERLRDAQETQIGLNMGGGAKVSLLGPIRVRLDYRLFMLRGSPLHSRVQRGYAGLNLAF